MKIGINKVVTFADNSKFLTLADADFEGIKYYYLAEIDEKEEAPTDNIRIVKKQEVDDKSYLIPVEDEEEMKKVAKLLSENLDKNKEIQE